MSTTGSINRGGRSPAGGYYWIRRCVGKPDETKPKIEELWADYVFAETTEWVGPLPNPFYVGECVVTPNADVSGLPRKGD